jgi:hypothetical protein
MADFAEAIRRDPQDARAYYWRSVARRKDGDQAGAKADLQAARRLDPDVDREP